MGNSKELETISLSDSILDSLLKLYRNQKRIDDILISRIEKLESRVRELESAKRHSLR